MFPRTEALSPTAEDGPYQDVDGMDMTDSDHSDQSAHSAHSAASAHHAAEPVTVFHVGQWLDVKDTVGAWCEAQVRKLDVVRCRICVHYKGWKDKFDEWLSPLTQRQRIALLHTRTPKPPGEEVKLMEGDCCDVLDTSDEWLPARIIAVTEQFSDTPSGTLCLVHYRGWSHEYDEWLQHDSYRIAPLNSRTDPSKLSPPSPVGNAVRKPPPLPDLRLVVETPKPTPPEHAVPVPSGDRVNPFSANAAATALRALHGMQTFCASMDEEARFRQLLLRKRGFAIRNTSSDGNCLFRAVSHQLYGTEDHHAIVREKCVRYMRDHRGFFANFITGDMSSYLSRMSQDGEWGDHVEIQALSELYNRPVEIYAYSTTPTRFGDKGLSKPFIRLSYHSRSHYNSVFHPYQHQQQILTTSPGEWEDKRIRLLTNVPVTLLQKVQYRSDLEATELAALQEAVALSRREFSQQVGKGDNLWGDDDLGEALKRSLLELDDMQAIAVKQSVLSWTEEQQFRHVLQASREDCQSDYNRSMRAALKASTNDYWEQFQSRHRQAHRGASSQDDQDPPDPELDSVRLGKRKRGNPTRECTALTGTSPVPRSIAATPSPLPDVDDTEVIVNSQDMVTQESQDMAPTAPGASLSAVCATEAATQSHRGLTDLTQAVACIEAAPHNDMPRAVRHCHHVLHFPLESCVMAYEACTEVNLGQDELVNRMVNFMLLL